jgi:hypothetical protein
MEESVAYEISSPNSTSVFAANNEDRFPKVY